MYAQGCAELYGRKVLLRIPLQRAQRPRRKFPKGIPNRMTQNPRFLPLSESKHRINKTGKIMP